jgi:spore germination protein KB
VFCLSYFDVNIVGIFGGRLKLEKSKISPQQLFCLIVLFEFGTALIVPAGVEAKQDAWLVELVGMTGGIFLLFLYYYLYHQYPSLLLTSYLKAILGKQIGFVIGFLYVLFFIYGGSRDLREASDLILIHYSETPMNFLSGIMMALICYALFTGIEVIARSGEIFFGIFFPLLILTFIVTIFSDVIQLDHLFPILENGWKPVLTTTFPNRIFFPYGELICFTVIFPYLNNRKGGMKFGLVAVIVSGVMLTITIMIEISVLGVNGLQSSVFPFLDLVEKINIGGFIKGLQGIEMVILIIGDFFKVTVFAYAAVICSTDLFKVRSYRKLVFIIGGMIYLTSIFASDNLVEHLYQGKVVLKSIFPLFEFIIPFLLVMVVLIQRIIRKQ